MKARTFAATKSARLMILQTRKTKPVDRGHRPVNRFCRFDPKADQHILSAASLVLLSEYSGHDQESDQNEPSWFIHDQPVERCD